MNALEKAKKLKQLTQLLEEKNQSKGLALAKVIKSILALRDELGMATVASAPQSNSDDAQVSNPLYQSIIDGTKSLSLDVVNEVLAEGEKEPEHWQLAQAVNVLAKQAIEQDVVSKDELQSIAGESMMFDDTGFDSWLRDGHYEQLPVSKLAVSTLADKIHCKPTKDNDPLLVFEPKQGKYLVLIGGGVFEKAENDDVDYLPCVILPEDDGYNLELIKEFIGKNTHRKFDAKDFAFELEEYIADTAELSI